MEWFKLLDMEFMSKFLKEFGLTKAILTILLIVLFYMQHKLYDGRLKDRKEEIDRLAKDNHEYRDRFMALLDEKFNYKEIENKKKE